MAKLFIALDLPASAKAELIRLQPPAGPGIRLTASDQMHLTLHFIGEGDPGRYAAALSKVVTPVFPQSFGGVGRFPSAGGSTTLWAGVRSSSGLLKLRASVATALMAEGFRPEDRPYNPHLTLARCEPGFSDQEIEKFLTKNSGFALPEVPITSVGLYSSTMMDGVPVYRLERGVALRSDT